MKCVKYCLVFLFLFAKPVIACEPAVQLTMVYGASIASLVGIVFLKAALFAWYERSLPWYKAAFYVIGANFFSSLIGIGLAFASSVPMFILFGLAMVLGLSHRPCKRFIQYNPWGLFKKWKPSLLAAFVMLLYFLSWVFFMVAQATLENWYVTYYWMYKFAYVMIAVAISLGLTTLWEDWVISELAKYEGSYFLTVLKINLVSFILIYGYFAIRALPERLKSDGFLM